MSKYAKALIDTGIIVAFYNSADRHHEVVVDFLAGCDSRLVTTVGCVTESMWLLACHWRIQNSFLNHLAQGIYAIEPLLPDDFVRIAERDYSGSDYRPCLWSAPRLEIGAN